MALTSTEESQTRALIAQNAALLSLAASEPTIIGQLGASMVSLADLTPAVSVSDTDLLLIRQGSTDKSVQKSLIATAVPDASDTVKGIVELATNVETQTGTDTVRAVTPSGLASVTSTTTRAGLVELATDGEVQTGTDAVRAVTPASMKAGLNASGTAPIYACRAWVNFNGTGTVAIRASGNVSSITDDGAGRFAVNFTTAMPDENFSAAADGMFVADDSAGNAIIAIRRTAFTTASVGVRCIDGAGSGFSDPLVACVQVFR